MYISIYASVYVHIYIDIFMVTSESDISLDILIWWVEVMTSRGMQ